MEEIVDAQGTDYEYIIGPRLGRTTSKEQYAYIYKVSAISPGESYTYSDPDDIFHREPFVAHFQAGDFTFVLINIHTDPDEATEEINALAQVVLDAQSHYTDEDDFITLGDLNADCRYFDEDDMSCPLRSADFTFTRRAWIVGASVGTCHVAARSVEGVMRIATSRRMVARRCMASLPLEFNMKYSIV